MNQGSTTRYKVAAKLDKSLIPQTWITFFNGPNAGTINIESAKKEIPWLISGKMITLHTGEGGACVKNSDKS
jgi:hypothetical protein